MCKSLEKGVKGPNAKNVNVNLNDWLQQNYKFSRGFLIRSTKALTILFRINNTQTDGWVFPQKKCRVCKDIKKTHLAVLESVL